MTHPDWSTFGEELGRRLESLTLGEFHVVDGGADAAVPGAYVQFKVVEEGIWCEAVSDVYLLPDLRLGHERTTLLELLGWEPPGIGGNWWAGMDGPHRFTRSAELAVNTLVQVYGVTDPGTLCDPASSGERSGVADATHDPGLDPDGPDQRIADAACTHGTYLGRDTGGLHRMELLGETIRLRLEDLGSVAVMHIALEVGSAESVDPAILRRTRPRGHPSATRPRLEEVADEDGSITFWLSTAQVLDLSPTTDLRLVQRVQSLIGPVGRLRAAASRYGDDTAA